MINSHILDIGSLSIGGARTPHHQAHMKKYHIDINLIKLYILKVGNMYNLQ